MQSSKEQQKKNDQTLLVDSETFPGKVRVNVQCWKNLMQLSAHETESDSRQITQLLAGNEIMLTEEPSESPLISLLHLLLLAALLKCFWGPVPGSSLSGLFNLPRLTPAFPTNVTTMGYQTLPVILSLYFE